MSWNINSNANSTWTNNATNQSIGVVANAIGKATTQGYKIASSKKLFFGNQQEVSFNFDNTTFSISYTNPSTNSKIDILKYNPTTDTTTYRGIRSDSVNLDTTTSSADGVPNISASDGKVVFTKNALNVGNLYVGV
tara:strand:+ start:2366 stop:2773 length:408 start_codon:yes stop_codon:yes gene_type:complete